MAEDWVAVGTWVMAVGTWAMVIVMTLANWRILRQNRFLVSVAGQQMAESVKQTQLMRFQIEVMMKNMERPKIIELTKTLLNPFIIQLHSEIQDFEGLRIGFPRGLSIWGKEDCINDLGRRHPDIREMIMNHEKNRELLRSRIDDLKKMIDDSEFKEKCRELITRYNETAPPEMLLQDPDSYAKEFIKCVIQGRTDLSGTYAKPMINFWRIHGSDLLMKRERDDIQSTTREVENLCSRYLREAQELRNRLVQLREEWVERFDLLREEIEPEKPVYIF